MKFHYYYYYYLPLNLYFFFIFIKLINYLKLNQPNHNFLNKKFFFINYFSFLQLFNSLIISYVIIVTNGEQRQHWQAATIGAATRRRIPRHRLVFN